MKSKRTHVAMTTYRRVLNTLTCTREVLRVAQAGRLEAETRLYQRESAGPNVWDLDTGTGHHVKEELAVVEAELGVGPTTLRGATDLLNAVTRIGLRVRTHKAAFGPVHERIKALVDEMKIAASDKIGGDPVGSPGWMTDVLGVVLDVHRATRAQRDEAVAENKQLRCKLDANVRAVKSLNNAAESYTDALREVVHAADV